MIELNDIAFAYKQNGFTLTCDALSIQLGERAAVVGPSGSGKTTLLHLIAGILVPSKGVVRVGDSEVSSLNDKARRRLRLTTMGMVFQGVELIDYLSARENVLLPCRINDGLAMDRDAKQRADALLERVGLSALSSRKAADSSQGEKQRIGICRALMAKPSLVLADEPTASLDEDNALSAMELLMQLVEEDGATLVMLTHDKSLLPRFDRVIAVDKGVVA